MRHRFLVLAMGGAQGNSTMYMADVLAGIAVGTMGFSVGTRLAQPRGALPEMKTEN